jgi:large subunit ribosomal protein L13
MKTYSAKPSEITREWLVVDANDVVLGRLATEVAKLLRGKHKPTYTPHMDTGDFVVVINADKIRLTGKKMEQKIYYSHSGYLGGLKSQPIADLLVKKPEEAVYAAIKGMIPHNKLGRAMLKKLKVYSGDKHPHEAQQPRELNLGLRR